jgi:predicted nuclease of predicted toxin-antitoxin system
VPIDYIKLYLDEDVSVLVGQIIRARGFDVLTTRDAGNLAASDADQLKFAAQNERVFLTHNRLDFERLAVAYHESGERHSGVVIAVRRSPSQMAARLFPILNATDATEMIDQIRYV